MLLQAVVIAASWGSESGSVLVIGSLLLKTPTPSARCGRRQSRSPGWPWPVAPAPCPWCAATNGPARLGGLFRPLAVQPQRLLLRIALSVQRQQPSEHVVADGIGPAVAPGEFAPPVMTP